MTNSATTSFISRPGLDPWPQKIAGSGSSLGGKDGWMRHGGNPESGSVLWGGVVFRQTPRLDVLYGDLQAQLCAQPTLRLSCCMSVYLPLFILKSNCSQM